MILWKQKSNDEDHENSGSIQHIAFKLVKEQNSSDNSAEKTVFVFGSKRVGKTTVINKFFEREHEQIRPTLALEYSYGRRSHTQGGIGKQVLNIWELESLEYGQQLGEFEATKELIFIIMLDLSQPQNIWFDLENACTSLRNTSINLPKKNEGSQESVRKDYIDTNRLELLPYSVVIVGGKYDLFMNFDPEEKKHVCRCLRSVAHLIGACLLFYSNKIPKLAKSLRDTISHLGFGSPTNPFRSHQTDYNDALMIWFGTDSWERIGGCTRDIKLIGDILAAEIPQRPTALKKMLLPSNPTNDPTFQEGIVDEMRSQKDEVLKSFVKLSVQKSQFESVMN